MCSCHSILECCVVFSGVKLSMGSFVLLDLSKTLIYDFHYNYIKKQYNDKAKPLFTDTQTYEIETEDGCKDFWSDNNKFDNSETQETPHIAINQTKE